MSEKKVTAGEPSSAPRPQKGESRADFLSRWSEYEAEKGWTHRAMEVFNAGAAQEVSPPSPELQKGA